MTTKLLVILCSLLRNTTKRGERCFVNVVVAVVATPHTVNSPKLLRLERKRKQLPTGAPINFWRSDAQQLNHK
jgi:hypothetical protein